MTAVIKIDTIDQFYEYWLETKEMQGVIKRMKAGTLYPYKGSHRRACCDNNVMVEYAPPEDLEKYLKETLPAAIDAIINFIERMIDGSIDMVISSAMSKEGRVPDIDEDFMEMLKKASFMKVFNKEAKDLIRQYFTCEEKDEAYNNL